MPACVRARRARVCCVCVRGSKSHASWCSGDGAQGTGHSFHVVYNVEPGYYMDWQSRYNFYWFLETQKDAG